MLQIANTCLDPAHRKTLNSLAPLVVAVGGHLQLGRRYVWGKQLGKGGFGQVRTVVEKKTGREFACKTICKRLDVPNFSPQKQAAHLDNVKREVIPPASNLLVLHFQSEHIVMLPRMLHPSLHHHVTRSLPPTLF